MPGEDVTVVPHGHVADVYVILFGTNHRIEAKRLSPYLMLTVSERGTGCRIVVKGARHVWRMRMTLVAYEDISVALFASRGAQGIEGGP